MPCRLMFCLVDVSPHFHSRVTLNAFLVLSALTDSRPNLKFIKVETHLICHWIVYYFKYFSLTETSCAQQTTAEVSELIAAGSAENTPCDRRWPNLQYGRISPVEQLPSDVTDCQLVSNCRDFPPTSETFSVYPIVSWTLTVFILTELYYLVL